MAIELNFTKLASNKKTTLWIGPSGGTTLGITDVEEPLAAEINNTGGTSGMLNASKATSWNDMDFGVQESETTNEPSLADDSNYEEFGVRNYGGGMSFYYPQAYNDPSNLLSDVYILTKTLGDRNDIVIRVDGNVASDQPAANGDFVSVYRAEVSSEGNPFTPGESKRRTVDFAAMGDFDYFTVVGTHTLVAIPPATDPWDEGRKARLRVSIQGRDVTNKMEFRSTDPTVVEVYSDGSYEVVGDAADTASIIITEPGTDNTVTQAVTVTAP